MSQISRMQLPGRANAVVVGGGVIGASVLFHLAEGGVSDALLIERDELGASSTSRAAGACVPSSQTR